MHFFFGLLLLGSGLISVRALLSSEELSSEEIENACVEETGVDIETVKCLPSGLCPDDPKLKCFVKCAMAAESLPIDEDGVVDPEVLLGMMEEDGEAVEASVRQCGKVRGTDACDTAYLTYMCWVAEGLITDSSEEGSSEEESVELSSDEKKYVEWHVTCVAETGVDEELLSCLPSVVCPDDRKLKCYTKCLLTQASIPMREDGTFDVEAIVEKMSDEVKEKSEPIVRKCATVKGADACDTAYLTVLCWIRQLPRSESAPELYEQLLDRR